MHSLRRLRVCNHILLLAQIAITIAIVHGMTLPEPAGTSTDVAVRATTDALSLPSSSVHVSDGDYQLLPRADDELETVDSLDSQPSQTSLSGTGSRPGGSRSVPPTGDALVAMQTGTSVSMKAASHTSPSPLSPTTDPETPPTVFSSSISEPLPPIPLRTILLIVGGFLIFGPLLLVCMSPCITRRLGELIRKSKRAIERKWMHSRKRELVRSFYARNPGGEERGGVNYGVHANRDWEEGGQDRHVPVRKGSGSGSAESAESVPSVRITQFEDEKRGDCYSMDFKDPSIRCMPYAAHEFGHGHMGANLIPHPYLTSSQQQQYAQDLNRMPSTTGSEHSAHSWTSTHSLGGALSGAGSPSPRPLHRSRISKVLPPLPSEVDPESSFDVNVGAGADAHLIRTPTLDAVQAHADIPQFQTHQGHAYAREPMSMAVPMRPPRPPTVDTPNLSDSVYLACVDIDLPYLRPGYGGKGAVARGTRYAAGPGESVDLGVGGNFAGVGTRLGQVQKSQQVQQVIPQPVSNLNSHEVKKPQPASMSKARTVSVPRSILKQRPETNVLIKPPGLEEQERELEGGTGTEKILEQDQEHDLASFSPQTYDSDSDKKFYCGTSADYVRLGSDDDYHPSQSMGAVGKEEEEDDEQEDGEKRISSGSRHTRTLSAPSLGRGRGRNRSVSNDFNSIKNKLSEFRKSPASVKTPAAGVSKTPRFSISLPKTQRSFLRMSRANAASVFRDISNSAPDATPSASEAEAFTIAAVPQDQAANGVHGLRSEDPPARSSKAVRESLADVRESLVKKVIDRKHRRSRSASGWAYPRKSQMKALGFDLDSLTAESKKKKVGFVEDNKEALGVVDE